MSLRLSQEWQLHHRLGAGGYGEVWEASTAAHGVRVAIKLLPPRPGDASEGVLPPEVSILAALRHPGVVRLLDAGTVTKAVGHILPGTNWLAMERVAGRPLGQAGLGGSRSLVAVLYQLLDTMAYIHSCGYVHGDLSPSNVLWSLRDWNVKVVDFGLARTAGFQPTGAVGTPGFLAPERRALVPLAPRADLYSIGRLGLHLLQHTRLQHAVLPGVPVDRLARWLHALSADAPSQRPPGAAEARAWLTELVGAPPTLAAARPMPVPALAQASSPATATVSVTAARPLARVPRTAAPHPSEPTTSSAPRHHSDADAPVPSSHWSRASIPLPPEPPSPSPSLELGWMATGATLFAARGSALVGRDELRRHLWQALLDSGTTPAVVQLSGPPGVGVSALLDDLARSADASGVAEVVRSPHTPSTARHTLLWVLDDAKEEELAFARAARSRGLVVLGRGGALGETLAVEPLPVPLRAALVRSMLPVTADVAGWLALRADGLPGQTRALLHTLLGEGRFALDGRRYGWAPGRRPEPVARDPAQVLAAARADFDAAANEQAWSRVLDLEQAGAVRPGEPHYSAWLDMVGILADRLPRDVPMALLASPEQASPDEPADAVYHRGMRALRLKQHPTAQQLFQQYIDRVETVPEQALGRWQLGAVAFGRGDFVDARAHFVAAHALLSDGSDPKRLAHTLLALSLVGANLGHFREALTRAGEATAAFEAIGQPRHRANIADFESSCYLWLGELELAEARARESLSRYADDGSPNRLVPLLNLAAALHHQGRAALVREILDEVARRAGFEEPRLLGVVALYGALFAAEEGDGELFDHHWDSFEQVWATGVGWHPSTARMLVDIGAQVAELGWQPRLEQLGARLELLRERFGSPVLKRFGADAMPTAPSAGD